MLIKEKIYNQLYSFNGETNKKQYFIKNIEVYDNKDTRCFINAKDCLSAYNKGGLLLNI